MKRFISLLMLLASGVAAAHDGDYAVKSACYQDANGDEVCVMVGEQLSVSIDIRPQDIGKMGAFYVGARNQEGDIAFLTRDGWTDGMSAYDYLDVSRSLPARFTTPAMRWETNWQIGNGLPDVSQSICAIAAKQNVTRFEIWVGYGAVQAETEAWIEQYNSIAVKDKPVDHFRLVYAYEDGARNGKYGKILDVSCEEGKPRWIPVGAAWMTSVIDPGRDFYRRNYR